MSIDQTGIEMLFPTVAADDPTYVMQECTISDDQLSYISALMAQASGTLGFRAGSGRILRDLLVHWPTLDGWEIEAQELCQNITDAVYPLAGSLFARAVEIEVRISASPIAPQPMPDTLATFIAYDTKSRLEKHCFLSPRHPSSAQNTLGVQAGIIVSCHPLYYSYHTIKDDRKKNPIPVVGIFEKPEWLINEMMEQPDFVPREKRVLYSLDASLKALFDTPFAAGMTALAMLEWDKQLRARRHPMELDSLASGLALLPMPMRAIESRLINYAADKTTSPEFRLGMRRIVQSLHEAYATAVVEQVAEYETQHLHTHITIRNMPETVEFIDTEKTLSQTLMPIVPPLAVLAFAASNLQSAVPIILQSAPESSHRNLQPTKPVLPQALSIHGGEPNTTPAFAADIQKPSVTAFEQEALASPLVISLPLPHPTPSRFLQTSATPATSTPQVANLSAPSGQTVHVSEPSPVLSSSTVNAEPRIGLAEQGAQPSISERTVQSSSQMSAPSPQIPPSAAPSTPQATSLSPAHTDPVVSSTKQGYEPEQPSSSSKSTANPEPHIDTAGKAPQPAAQNSSVKPSARASAQSTQTLTSAAPSTPRANKIKQNLKLKSSTMTSKTSASARNFTSQAPMHNASAAATTHRFERELHMSPHDISARNISPTIQPHQHHLPIAHAPNGTSRIYSAAQQRPWAALKFYNPGIIRSPFLTSTSLPAAAAAFSFGIHPPSMATRAPTGLIAAVSLSRVHDSKLLPLYPLLNMSHHVSSYDDLKNDPASPIAIVTSPHSAPLHAVAGKAVWHFPTPMPSPSMQVNSGRAKK